MDRIIPCLDPPPLPTDDGRLSPSSVLLDDRAYISAAAVSNATTADAALSTGNHIQVSFCLAGPRRLSYLCVHFPGPVAGPAVGTAMGPAAGTAAVRCVGEAPRVISTHAHLALIRVPIPGARGFGDERSYDYFVYTARPRRGASSLNLVPPRPLNLRFRDDDVAILRCSGSRYVIPCLKNTVNPLDFMLHRYDSDTHRWTSTPLTVYAPERDRVLPIPGTATEVLFHDTTKVITIGGQGGTIGWVDLWRGILYCNVLDEKPVLRDMPLPKPPKANRRSFCRGCPYYYRDITVLPLPEQQEIKIVYVVMEIRPGDVPSSRQQENHSGSDSDSDSDVDVADYWKATVWTMPVPIASWKDWHKDCQVDVTDIIIDNPSHSELLLGLPKLSSDPEEAIWRMRRLMTGHPTLGLGLDGNVVICFLSKVDYRDCKGWVIAVGARDRKLRGIAGLDNRKNCSFRRYFRPTEISRYLVEATGEAGTLVRSRVQW